MPGTSVGTVYGAALCGRRHDIISLAISCSGRRIFEEESHLL